MPQAWSTCRWRQEVPYFIQLFWVPCDTAGQGIDEDLGAIFGLVVLCAKFFIPFQPINIEYVASESARQVSSRIAALEPSQPFRNFAMPLVILVLSPMPEESI